MKKTITIIGFVLFAMFYCFAIEKAAPTYDLNSDTSKELSIEKYSFLSAPSANLVAGMVHFRTISQNASIPSFSFSSSYEESLAIVEYAEQLFASKFAQYSSFSINLLIELKKSNLTFPFYYFW